MRLIMLFSIIILLISGCGKPVQKGAVDFSGEWTFNTEQSDMGGERGMDRGGERSGEREGRRGGMGMGPSKMVVERSDNTLSVETFRTNRDGEEFSMKVTYSLDGKKSKNKLNFGTQVSEAKWSDDGKTLTIESTMTMSRGEQDFTMESTEKWSLENGVLTIEAIRYTPMGERKSKAVYDKAEKSEE